MNIRRHARAIAASAALVMLVARAAHAQQFDSTFAAALRWRMIGPFRGGRTVAAVGVPGHPATLYIGVNHGGAWKSTDYGRTWTPIFDDQPTGSVGSMAVAPSDPNTIYIGSGEGLQRPDLSVGDGVYKSTNAGATWTRLGLRDGQQIAQLIVDPANPNRVFAAVIGHPYGPNTERGIFRSLDGGVTWDRVLYKDENTGGVDVQFDPANPQTLYADLWAARQAPWEAGFTLSASNGLYKSTDGGATWRQLTNGLPGAADGLGRIGLGMSKSEPARIYAVVGASKSGGGIYRSDDAGENWRKVADDPRLWGRDGDFNEIKADPTNADVVYIANVVSWKSTDGGKTFSAFKGAPGGDDYHRFWINPEDSKVILLASDQGAIVTQNGGETWSSWYNQPTAQMYHVSTDNRFPYWVYGGQQESGSVGIASRGNDGAITYREWHPVGAEEYGYVAPDPLHPNLIYGGKITRFDWNTGDVQELRPDNGGKGAPYRFVRTMPILFSPVDPRVLYFAGNVLFKTLNGGVSWTVISPDLTRTSYDIPPSMGVFKDLDPEHGGHRGVIYTIAPSPRKLNLLWVGTDDGLIHVTHNGGTTWKNVTPPALTPWSKVSLMEASRWDTLGAYAAVNRFRLDDVKPHIYRTRDGGKTWAETVTGIGENEVVNAVRQDPVRRGLLFAGTERQVYVSWDDGDHWRPLRLNMPATSVRDLTIHESDLVIGTHGRGFWILDGISPLRQFNANMATQVAGLFQPQVAYRVRWNRYTDTPLPGDEPMADNPPDGAIIDYYLARPADGPVTLEIRDAAGQLVRRYSSTDPLEPIDSSANIPLSWVRAGRVLSPGAGAHRFLWDVRYAPPDVQSHGYPIAAVPHNTPRLPLGPWALPGRYTVKLTANGASYTQPLTVRMDPRIHTTAQGLAQQLAVTRALADALHRDWTALHAAERLRTALADRKTKAQGTLADAIGVLDGKVVALTTGPDNLGALNDRLAAVYDVVEGSDAAPTLTATAAATRAQTALATVLARWTALAREIAALDTRLKAAGLEPVGTSGPGR